MKIWCKCIAAAVLGLVAFAAGAQQQKAELYIQTGHTRQALSGVFSPDGRQVLSSGFDGTLRLWDAQSGREIRTFNGHTAGVMAVAYFPDGKTAVSASVDWTLRVWDIESGRELKTLTGHEDWVNRVAVSPDGKLIASVSGDKTLRIWDAASGKEINRITAHDDFATAVAFSPDGRLLATGNRRSGPGSRMTIAIYETGIWREARRINVSVTPGPGPRGTPNLAFSPDGKLLLAALLDPANSARVYEVASGSAIAELKGHRDEVNGVAFSPDGRFAATGSFDNTAKLWDTASWRELRTFSGHAHYVNTVAFSPDGRELLTAGNDGPLRKWEVASGRELVVYRGEVTGRTSLAVAGDRIVVGGPGRIPHIWSLETGKLQAARARPGGTPVRPAFSQRTLRGTSTGFGEAGIDQLRNRLNTWRARLASSEQGIFTLSALAASPDGSTIAIGSPDNDVRLIELKTGKELRSFHGHTGYVTSAAFSPDGRQIVTGSRDRSVILWEVATGNQVRAFEGHQNDVFAVAFAPDGKRFVSVGWDATAMIRSADSVGPLETMKLQRGGAMMSVAWSPDGKTIATGDTQKQIILWDADTGRARRALDGHLNWVTALAFTADSKTLVSGSWDGTVRLWEAASGTQRRSIAGHNNVVSGLVPLKDGRLVSTGWDGAVRIWNMETGANIVTMTSFGDGEWVSATPDGHFNASENGAKWLTVRFGNKAYGLDQYHEAFFRPDLVTLALAGDTSQAALAATAVAEREKARAEKERIEQARLAREKAEQARLALERQQLARLERERSEKARLEKERIEQAQRAREKSEQERARREQAELALLALVPVAPVVPSVPARIPGSQRIEEVKPAPTIAFVDPPASAASDQLTLRLRVADNGGGVGDVRVYLNGAAVMLERTRNLQVAGTGQVLSYTIRLVNGQNSIRAVAFNTDNTMQSLDALHEVIARLGGPRRPALHALVIGIQEFDNPKLTLKYSVADAELFAATLRSSAAGLFESVNITKLVTKADTTRDKLLAAVRTMQQQAGPEDLFVFYVASHGTVDEGEYFLVTSNVGSTSSSRLRRDAISQNDLKGLLANIPATKKLIVLDTCNAGKLGDVLQVAMLTRGMSEDAAFKILARAMGTTILSAATSQQEALEGYNDHGLFTYVIADGLSGKADTDHDGFVKTTELADYVDNEVPELAERLFKHKQYPVISPSGQGFPLGRVK